jgi:hypothetical protein
LKENYKYTIINPEIEYAKETAIKDMKKIQVNLKICTLYKGVPYGPSLI